ncbi:MULTISPECIES: hypothetical protein [Enterobacterales]|jgi:hypothetical protein|uniref:Lipoprotein n=4 Tax=Providencia TaxID=586 RepID=A0A899NGK6_PROST|nr:MULTISPECIES: hypothetical protein [Enterobacterales]ELB1110450.1 hypothetical protein [Morganella morganii]EKH6496508.1 hypothetical protein [Providencia rettgeri]ELL8907456.1 hypothetical protein [Proteus mirabilis]ELQ1458033.1 hypothetical protein [Providencia rettgeri]ELR5042737.1 hypothetical protein [Providencia rettgeri]
MFKRIRGVPFLAGAIAALCMTSAFAEIPTNASGRPVAGKSMAEFQSYKASCPECLQVAQDIIKMRTQHCQQAGDVDQTILQDPIYPYLNGIRVMLANRGGYNSPMYTSARQVFEANVNCENSSDWVERSQKVIENTFSGPK